MTSSARPKYYNELSSRDYQHTAKFSFSRRLIASSSGRPNVVPVSISSSIVISSISIISGFSTMAKVSSPSSGCVKFTHPSSSMFSFCVCVTDGASSESSVVVEVKLKASKIARNMFSSDEVGQAEIKNN
ncbi:hypothetical protein GCK72_000018 [Caenorhabditis remanei]|uniref:Uncharacterized protein n=1 Tax=Caenorhabditis remanei TaxID=31234 RepID=A0A6A5HNI7_CAERE|nr:hypothetical protein GCK72_000018 [Caenorhabditis remanei]KAF1768206.1 hypothetical protein GCK72_000018 [Caenorhabditis remanei]